MVVSKTGMVSTLGEGVSTLRTSSAQRKMTVNKYCKGKQFRVIKHLMPPPWTWRSRGSGASEQEDTVKKD